VARPKSEDKRNAILDAATRLFAERGLAAAPTSEISSLAGVAEGTLFTYFGTKDELINSLYRELKLELADAMMSDFPRKTKCSHQAAACLGSLCPLGHCKCQAAQGAGATAGVRGAQQRVQGGRQRAVR
jgi:AcrR family transcriptional regulator